MPYIRNCAPYPIIINITNHPISDHSNIENYKIGPESIILEQEKFTYADIPWNANIYICTSNCKYLGHFTVDIFRILADTTIYVGIIINRKIVFVNNKLITADINFGLAETIDQSDPSWLLLDPYLYLIIIAIILVLILSIINYAYTCWSGVSDSQ